MEERRFIVRHFLRIAIATVVLLSTFLQGHSQYKVDLVVAQDGSGDYTSIQQAIDDTKAFPDERITITIRNGVYREKVTVHSWNTSLSMIGESRDSVIITWDDHFNKIGRGRNSTFHTYTMLVDANDFYAENLTIRNTSSAVGQAIALSVEADRSVFVNCSIEGFQDTLYVSGEGNRQYFKACMISGSTDFIFGNATAVFEDCQIHSRSGSYITAASTAQGSGFGLVFLTCSLTADENVTGVLLGRPWRAYAHTAFLHCQMGAHIHPSGWANWGDPQKEETVHYAEYSSSGIGGSSTGRVAWARQLSEEEARKYTLENIFEGWFPGVE